MSHLSLCDPSKCSYTESANLRYRNLHFFKASETPQRMKVHKSPLKVEWYIFQILPILGKECSIKRREAVWDETWIT